jgi:hypothetical protein
MTYSSPFGVPDRQALNRYLNDIAEVSHESASFWSAAHGWASDDIAHLLSKAQLHLLASLGRTLRNRIDEIYDQPEEEGVLIMAWVHLRSLIEGHLKLFFTVFMTDYERDPIIDKKTKKPVPFAHLRPNQILTYCRDRKLLDGHYELIQIALARGNMIHAFATHNFENRNVGNADEYFAAIEDYRDFLFDVLSYLPRPD